MPRPPVAVLPAEGLPVPDADERASAQVRQVLGEVVKAIRPTVVVRGHWHRAFRTERDDVSITGLDCDGTDQAVAVLELDTLKTWEWNLPC